MPSNYARGARLERLARDKAVLFSSLISQLPLGCDWNPVAEYNFDACLGRKHRFDFAFVEQRLAVEVDGGQWAAFGGRHSRDSDREKLNIAAALGWRVMHFSPQQLQNEPMECLEWVEKALLVGAKA